MALSPFEVDAGVSQLRVQPVNETPDDGSFVFVLGTDQLPAPLETLDIGDSVRVSQTVTITTDFISFTGRFRQPASLPIRETLPGPVTVTRTTRGASPDITVVDVGSAFFIADEHNERQVRLEGAGITNGTYKIFFVNSSTQAILDGEPLAVAGGPTAVTTAHLQGARWQLRLLFDGTEVFSMDPGSDGGQERDLVLPNLTINVSKFSGDHEIAYELKLVETV